MLHYVSLTIFASIFIALEAWHQWFLRKSPIAFNEPSSVMTDLEFQMEVQKGKQKLVILDDLVLDVTEFQSSHPGGKFLLEKTIGHDISKYFHGGYSLEPLSDSKDHKHSNYARTIVNSLIVARYVGKRDFACMQSTKKVALTDNENEDISPVSVFYMAAKGGTGTSKTRRMFYPGLDTVGRHYLVQEQDADGYPAGNARQYTVAATMEPALYEAYTSALANPASGTEGLKKAI